MKNIFAVLLGLFVCWSSLVYAQEDACPTIVSDALAAVDSLCDETGRNQACYGNVTLTAEVQEGAEALKFEAPGDIANVADIRSLALSPMDEAAGEWGVSLMKLQANLPDTLPGQNVTVLLFGDVEIENAVGESSDEFTPMQAFYFRSGIGDSSCAEGPDSGILIQTPKGQRQVALRVNEVDIALGSTVFLQAVPDNALYVNVIEGQAQVTAFDETKTVLAGRLVKVPLDENLRASGPPNVPEPSVAKTIEGLAQVIALLPEAVTPIEPVVDESGGCTVTAGGAVNLRSGPGTAYARTGGLAANESANPTGQAVGADGYVWWQLDDGKWVRADVVEASGDCENVPVENDPPPTPTPAPVVSGDSSSASPAGGYDAFLHVGKCNTYGSTLRKGGVVKLVIGTGFSTDAERDAVLATASSTISVNGENLPVSRNAEVFPGPPPHPGIETVAYWTPPAPGVYTFSATDDRGSTVTCTLTVS